MRNKLQLPQVVTYDKDKIIEMGNMLDKLVNKLMERRNHKNNTNSININQQNLPGTSDKKRFNATSIE